MTVAAAYARFSSDAQREESIEIQLREIRALADRQGFTIGATYRDEAVSGWKSGRREDFDRMLDDAEKGLFDVLLVYKMDRFARNVEVAQRAKRRLLRAGVTIWSVREGELRDSPDSWLMSAFGDAMAEYYSRNLSVMVRNGIDQSARQLKAAGRRIWGYAVDGTDHFVPDESTAPAVREVFARYASGESLTDICSWLNSEGVRTPRGKTWCTQNLAQVLGNVAYKGTYKYSGHVVEGGMPALVSAEQWDRVQQVRATRKRKKRKSIVNDYLLTGKIWCLECGRPMCGTAGTSATGRKYTYYGCVRKDGGCGLRVSAEKVERAVLRGVAELLADQTAVDEIVADMVAYAKSRPNRAEEYRQEASRLRREADRLIESVAQGIPAESVRDALREREDRLRDLRRLVTIEENAAQLLPDEENVRRWLEPYLDVDYDDPEWREMVVTSFVSHVFADKETVAVAFNLDDGSGPYEVSWEQVRDIANARTTSSEIVRACRVWWGAYSLVRTPPDPPCEAGSNHLIIARL